LHNACNVKTEQPKGNSATESDKQSEKEFDTKTMILGSWMLLRIGEQEAEPGYTITFSADGKSIAKGGENEEISNWSIETNDGKEILSVGVKMKRSSIKSLKLTINL
jgi:WD40 repeat protein